MVPTRATNKVVQCLHSLGAIIRLDVIVSNENEHNEYERASKSDVDISELFPIYKVKFGIKAVPRIAPPL
jgi:hypothetical protein